MVGAGESGKSTIFRQMQILYEKGFSLSEKESYRAVCRRNIVESIQALIRGCEKFNYPLTTEVCVSLSLFISHELP